MKWTNKVLRSTAYIGAHPLCCTVNIGSSVTEWQRRKGHLKHLKGQFVFYMKVKFDLSFLSEVSKCFLPSAYQESLKLFSSSFPASYLQISLSIIPQSEIDWFFLAWVPFHILTVKKQKRKKRSSKKAYYRILKFLVSMHFPK